MARLSMSIYAGINIDKLPVYIGGGREIGALLHGRGRAARLGVA